MQLDYRRVFEISTNENYVFSASSLLLLEVNERARNNLGYSIDELHNLTALDIMPEYTPETFANLIAPVQINKHPKIHYETIYLRKDSTTYPVEVHLHFGKLGDESVIIATALDITERQRLVAHNSEMGRIFDDSLNEIYIFDADTLHFLSVNRGACRNLGYTLEELQGMTPIDIKPEHTLETFTELIVPLSAGEKESTRFETSHLRKDGTTYPVEVHLHQTTFEGKNAFAAIILDITERKETEQKLLDLTLRKQYDSLIQNFISDTSHEFRTSLSIINVKSYLLSKKDVDDAAQGYIDDIQTHVKRLESLIESLQKVSVLETTQEISVQPISINTVVKNILDAKQATCKKLFEKVN